MVRRRVHKSFAKNHLLLKEQLFDELLSWETFKWSSRHCNLKLNKPITLHRHAMHVNTCDYRRKHAETVVCINHLWALFRAMCWS